MDEEGERWGRERPWQEGCLGGGRQWLIKCRADHEANEVRKTNDLKVIVLDTVALLNDTHTEWRAPTRFYFKTEMKSD